MWKLEDIQNSPIASINEHLFNKKSLDKKPPKRPKYGSNKTEFDGIVFDSKKETARYKELKLLLKTGHIGFLELQKEYELNEGGTHSLKYFADFVYVDAVTGKAVVEDCKGFKTREYIKKRRLMKKIYGIIIFES